MANLSASDLLPVLKEIYPNGVPKELVFETCPFLGMVPKDTEEAYGEHIKVPLLYADPQGTSATFANAQSNKTGSKWKAFELDTVDHYGVTGITGRAIDKSKKDRGSFVRGLKTQMDGIMRTVGRRLSHNIFRNHGGALAVGDGAWTVGSTTFVTSTARDIRHIEPGAVLVAATTDGTSGAPRSGSVTVSSVNRRTGQVIATGNWTAGIAAVANTDYIFKQGDFGAMMSGLDSWIPAADPGATAFFGVDRTADVIRLGGNRKSMTGIPIEEAVEEMLQIVADEGGKPDVILLSTPNWRAFSQALGSKKEYGTRNAWDAEIGYRSIKVMGPNGEVDVIADPDSQSDVAWVLQMNTWKLYSMGELVRILDDDGLPYLREASSDGVEVRVVSRPQLGCMAPGWNGRFAI